MRWVDHRTRFVDAVDTAVAVISVKAAGVKVTGQMTACINSAGGPEDVQRGQMRHGMSVYLTETGNVAAEKDKDIVGHCPVDLDCRARRMSS